LNGQVERGEFWSGRIGVRSSTVCQVVELRKNVSVSFGGDELM
jgi:hypothetical protein